MDVVKEVHSAIKAWFLYGEFDLVWEGREGFPDEVLHLLRADKWVEWR